MRTISADPFNFYVFHALVIISDVYSDRLHDFSVAIPRCYKDVCVNSFCPGTARLWNSVAIECFPLAYDLSDFKSRINKHLLTTGSF